MTKNALIIAALTGAGLAACSGHGAEPLSTQPSASPQVLASCSIVESGTDAFRIRIVRETPSTLRFEDTTRTDTVSALVTATKELNAGTVRYTISTAAGNSISVSAPYPVAGSGQVVILDRSVIGGACTPDSVQLDLRALDTLVSEAKPQPRYLFGQCSWNGRAGARVTARQGIDPSTIIFEADLAAQGRGSETFSYVATGMTAHPKAAEGAVTFRGQGNVSWSGLGRHTTGVSSLELSAPTDNGNSLIFATDGRNTFDPLLECTISNLSFVRRVLGHSQR